MVSALNTLRQIFIILIVWAPPILVLMSIGDHAAESGSNPNEAR